jgi:uncharacterized protein YggE
LRVVPDEAVISFSIETDNQKDLIVAKTENDAITSAVIKHVKSRDVKPEAFKVTDFSMGPRYGDHRTFLGYYVTRSFEIRTPDFGSIDPLIAGIVKAGGDAIAVDELHLQVRDQRAQQVETRRLAVEYARTKAAHLAELNQMQLGEAIEILEDVEYNYDAGGFGGFGGGFSGVHWQAEGANDTLAASPAPSRPADATIQFISTQIADKSDQAKDAKPEETDLLLSPGQVSLNATVKIKFELLPKK